jgi:hypothetical protein
VNPLDSKRTTPLLGMIDPAKKPGEPQYRLG